MWQKLNLPEEIAQILGSAPKVVVANTVDDLFAISTGTPDSSYYEVAYQVPGKGYTVEATVARVRNGISVNL